VGEGDETRLIAWAQEMRAVHGRLREALQVSRETAEAYDDPAAAGRDLLLYCRGFCTALSGHHRGEDDVLFPALVAAHPELRPTIEKLRQDHSMIAYLLTALQDSLEGAPTRQEIERHLEGIGAIMESHFRYEERALLTVLESLDLAADVDEVLGPL
jgi:hemerythrin-like domain-containing protein